MFGLGWLAVELAVDDGDVGRAPLYIGLVGLARAMPAIALALVAGAVVDRSDRRRVMLLSQGTSMALTAGLAVLAATGHASIGLVMLFTALIGLSTSFDGPARQSMLSIIVPPRDIMSAVGLQSVASHGTGIVGPAIAGILIGPVGVGGLLFANAFGYLPVMLAVRLMAPMPPVSKTASEGLVTDVREGLRYIAHDPVVRWTFVVGMSLSFLARPYLNLLPAFVANHLMMGPSSLSLLLTVNGVGALGGAIAVASVSAVARRGALLLGAATMTGACVIVLGLQNDLVGAAAAATVAGTSVLLYMGVQSTILQTTTPDALLGRVMSAQMIMWMGAMPLGQLVLGAIGSFVGIELVYVAGGAAATMVALLALRFAGPLRRLNASRAAPLDVGAGEIAVAR